MWGKGLEAWLAASAAQQWSRWGQASLGVAAVFACPGMHRHLAFAPCDGFLSFLAAGSLAFVEAAPEPLSASAAFL